MSRKSFAQIIGAPSVAAVEHGYVVVRVTAAQIADCAKATTLTCGGCGAEHAVTLDVIASAADTLPCTDCTDGGIDLKHARRHGDDMTRTTLGYFFTQDLRDAGVRIAD